MSSKKKGGRTKRAARYTEDHHDDEEDIPAQTFDVAQKLRSKDFPRYFIREISGTELSIEYLQRKGFTLPLFIREKTGLHITVPDSSFSISDVRALVGGKRNIDVMNCATQQNSGMTMKEWEDFFTDPNRPDVKLNVLSLEFSHTKLDAYVTSPRVVRQIDWLDNVWPRHLKEDQDEGTNELSKMKYPKVQKYCLMSVAGCYTDFHIDFGGTSVWYHIVKGQKVFWLIPPTDANLKAYEDWTLSGKQSDVFFGDIVEKCGRVIVDQGNTLLIPSGWIHAVYTPKDSLVFGGNFLHSFSIEKQLRVAEIEELTKVPNMYRFPFFTEMQWYALDKYVYALLGRSHLQVDHETKLRLFGDKYTQTEVRKQLEEHQHVTPQELYGLKAIVMFIHSLPVTRKCLPSLLSDPVSLIKDIRTIIDTHKEDDPSLAVTGRPLLYWTGLKQDKSAVLKAKNKARRDLKDEKPEIAERVACKSCENCQVKECGKCSKCTSYPRKMCERRRCENKVLHPSTTCVLCGLDGWYAETSMTLIDRPRETSNLMECSCCREVTHPTCHTDYGVEGQISEITRNSWFCPKCMKFNPPSEEELAAKLRKVEEPEFVVHGKSNQPKSELRAQLADKILAASKKPVKAPQFVYRPPPLEDNVEDVLKKWKDEGSVALINERAVMLPVFQYLTSEEVVKCARVCKAWYKISLDPSLWDSLNLTMKKFSSRLLSVTVQKQPVKLILDWACIGKHQLTWLLPRLPQTKEISMAGLDYLATVVSLSTCNTPLLQVLNLSHVSNLTDTSIYKLLSNPKDTRPGLLDKKTRLKNLKKLNVSGTDISDISIRYIIQYLPQITDLNISNCWKLTDAGLAQIGAQDATSVESLSNLDISSCRGITDSGIVHLRRCKNLTRVNATHSQVSSEALESFVANSEHKLKVYGHIVDRRNSSRKSIRK
eukprot:TRINITY_DN4126_c0_g1_i2.p1 TRINITY_DN4126_c0_g1~~TRINITY_DN4126_c0_g1_i2.p1  ORF type:complete len:935 (+),score=174.46 TRINITY_DN4126_c0_g1_i2:37-2841(+)